MRRSVILFFLIAAFAVVATAQRSDLSGLTFCIDPGHGGNDPANDRHVIPDPGTDFWESESNFQKALLLRPMLQALGATVYLTRETNYYPSGDEPSLAARVAFANSVNANWFHSIHSNAAGGVNTSVNRTLMLVREKVVTDSVYGPGTGVPLWPQAWDISAIMGPQIVSKLRTQSWSRWLDYSFYGTYTLGVLRGLQMPGELSEGSFHDYYPETRRLMNNSYRKMEAYALRNSYMQYFGLPADSLCIVAGIQNRRGFSTLIDGSQVRLLPEDRLYNGDSYHNGFYMFDSIAAGLHTVVFETPGYDPDSVEINFSAGSTVFLDRALEPTPPPTILSTTPANNDTAFKANLDIAIQFSKVMDTAAVRSAFTIVPFVSGKLLWSANNTLLTFAPDSIVLPFDQAYTITIDTTAKSDRGMYLDGNGDGNTGDPFVLQFKTEPVDAWPPVIVAAYPAPGQTVATSNQVINITFDEPLNPSTVNSTNVAIRVVGGLVLPRTVQYWEANGKGGINLYVTNGLTPGLTYLVRISDVADLTGNSIPGTSPITYEFSTASDSYLYTTIDDFNTDPTTNWWQPSTSGSTTGLASSTLAADASRYCSFLGTSTASARLTFAWDTTQAAWLVREYLSGGTPRSVTWNKRMGRLQAYVWGDGSKTLFRFAVDDSVDAFPAGTAGNHEISEWIPVDWVGWRLVEWDLENDPVGSWLGNGILEGQMRFDSFQLSYDPDSSAATGELNFDQLQIAKNSLTAVEKPESGIPDDFALLQNYPNPFNPSTTISYALPTAGQVQITVFDILGREVARLVDAVQPAGTYAVVFNTGALPSGVYIYRMTSGSFSAVRKMQVLK